MKTGLVTLILFMLSLYGYSQKVMYDIHGKFKHPVTKDVLLNANYISDFVNGYPSSWITDYISVEITTSLNGKESKAIGNNNTLSASQKTLLSKAELSSGISVEVKYKYANPVTDKIEVRNANMSLTVVPNTQASFPGGYKKMNRYFSEKGIDEISERIAHWEEDVKVNFLINEEGKATNVEMTKSSKDSELNQKILDSINNMPAWIPAKDSNGFNVKQEFEFTISGMDRC